MTGHARERGNGDLHSVVTSFYDRSVREVYGYFHRATAGDRRLAEDLTQETFMACVRAASSGLADATTMPWLMGVARHKLIDHYRRSSREERKLSLVWSSRADEASVDLDITDTAAFSALAELSAVHRLVLVLRYLDDLSVNQIADEIGKSVRATESLLVRARQALNSIVREANHD